jgi:hypothetical protein
MKTLDDQPPFTQVMIDLETVDVATTAVVVSIGAVYFNHKALGPTFYRVLSTDDQQQRGRTVSQDTLKWWAQQSAEARKVFDEPATHTPIVLDEFAAYLGDKNIQVWGNGADFDCTIWGDVYRSFGIKRPWSYSNNRCYRTLKNVLCSAVPTPARKGTHHNALDDAVHQALCAQIYMRGFGAWKDR